MKKNYLLLAVLLFISPLFLKAQVATLSEKETLSLLCYKWEVTKIQSFQGVMKVKPRGDYTMFNSDFTMESKEDDKIKKSKWSFSFPEKKVTFEDDGSVYKIMDLSTSELHLKGKWSGEMVVLILKRVTK
ncbi:hypothetical protein GFS24_01675 [Chitinophaga sp. SYP-B3965]|uniref:hypothetical protein n=1 Tax=Chitinophaga sp. SYP-B3965 TaxID=2663120 RepID=UPI001299B37E|nr:hypothetical protein [Chitinophaga sp. SYP-B3965]MRG43800.1 hypothetical protein [Chitinophaga sp. SYP-B3965]